MSSGSVEVVAVDHSRWRLEDVRGFIGGLHGHDLHAKRVDAPAGATLGVMAGAPQNWPSPNRRHSEISSRNARQAISVESLLPELVCNSS